MKNTDTQPTLQDRAVDSANLQMRASGNKQFGDADFNGWVSGIIDDLQYSSVLDICCGTGNQLVLYAARPGTERMVGVDLSTESLSVTGERVRDAAPSLDVALIEAGMDDAFDNPVMSDRKFDLVSCFYGLYYALDVAGVLSNIVASLADEGTVLIVGPYGENNASLFGILNNHFELPQLVTRSATTFMEAEVLPILSAALAVESRTFVNRVSYPNPTTVMNYWKASTFYNEAAEVGVAGDIDRHFRDNGKFVVEKHVMAILGRKAESP